MQFKSDSADVILHLVLLGVVSFAVVTSVLSLPTFRQEAVTQAAISTCTPAQTQVARVSRCA